MLLVILLVFGVSTAMADPEEISAELIVQAFDKDGWIGKGTISIEAPNQEEMPQETITKWELVTNYNIDHSSEAQGVTFKLKAGQYRVRVYRDQPGLELSVCRLLYVHDQYLTEYHAFFDTSEVSIALNNDQPSAKGSFSIEAPYLKTTPEGDVIRWRAICNANEVATFSTKIRPGRYRLRSSFKDNQGQEHLYESELQLAAQARTTVNLDVTTGVHQINSAKAPVSYPAPANPVSHTFISSGAAGQNMTPVGCALTAETASLLGLPPGAKGILLRSPFYSLPSGVVVEPLFHRVVSNEVVSFSEWSRLVPGEQILLGYWEKVPNGIWERQIRVVEIPEGFRPQSARTFIRDTLIALPKSQLEALQSLKRAKSDLQKEMLAVFRDTSNSDPSSLQKSIAAARTAFNQVLESEPVREARNAVLASLARTSPLAHKILIRTVDKTVEDREEIIIDLMTATIIGDSSAGPMVIDNALNATLEILTEEAILTENQARVLRGACTLIDAVNGLSNTTDLLSALSAVQESYKGLVEIGLVKKGKANDKVHARLKAGSEVLDLVIRVSAEECNS